jgi:tetratricopeptide repeat protein 21B
MTQTVGRTPVIAYLEALLTIKKPNQTNNTLAEFYRILDGALKMQIAYNKTLLTDFSYYSKFDPNFLFSISELYLRPISAKEMIEGTENPNQSGPIGKGITLLERIIKQIPGFVPAYLLLAKGKLAVGNELDAGMAVAKVLAMDNRNEEASILMAMIRSKKKDYEAALNSLQEAIAINFKIRENPLFMLIKAEIEYEMKNYQASEETMVQAISLPSVKKRMSDESNKKFKVLSFSEKDRCSIYLLLAKSYTKNGKQK